MNRTLAGWFPRSESKIQPPWLVRICDSAGETAGPSNQIKEGGVRIGGQSSPSLVNLRREISEVDFLGKNQNAEVM